MEGSKELLSFYRKGNAIGLIISPFCIPLKDEKGNHTGKTECIEHTHDPEKLGEMLDAILVAMKDHGFQIEVFGGLTSVQKSVAKRTGHKFHSEEAMIKFANYCNPDITIINAEDLNEWKAKYYAEEGK